MEHYCSIQRHLYQNKALIGVGELQKALDILGESQSSTALLFPGSISIAAGGIDGTKEGGLFKQLKILMEPIRDERTYQPPLRLQSFRMSTKIIVTMISL